MADFRTYTHQFIVDFITVYQENPCLWRVSSIDYLDRSMKNEAYDKLLQLVQKVDENADIHAVKKKINTLRACFRKERKKIRADSAYRPKLWYYSMLYFLDDQEEPSQSNSNHNDDSDDGDDDYRFDSFVDSKENLQLQEKLQEATTEHNDFIDETPEYRRPKTRTSERNKRKISIVKTEIADMTEVKLPKNPDIDYEDEYDAVGKNVAAKLRRLSSHMKIIAEKLINEVLYKAQVNSLSVNSTVTTS